MDWTQVICHFSCQNRVAYLKRMTEMWNLDVRSIVEIGVFRGEMSLLLRQYFPQAHLYLIDPWRLYNGYCDGQPISINKDDYEAAYQSVSRMFVSDSQTTLLRKFSVEAASSVPDGLDLVYIDGNHSYASVKQDILTWLPKIRSGGIISGHDYTDKFPGVVSAVDEIFAERVITSPGGVWLLPVAE